ncbi:unnamed protein product [Merluccius merluccius]
MIVLFGQDTHPQKYMLPRSPGGWFVTRPIPPVSSALLDGPVTQFRGGRNNATSGTVICRDLRLKASPLLPAPHHSLRLRPLRNSWTKSQARCPLPPTGVKPSATSWDQKNPMLALRSQHRTLQLWLGFTVSPATSPPGVRLGDGGATECAETLSSPSPHTTPVLPCTGCRPFALG